MSKIGKFQMIKPDDWLFQDYGVVAQARARAEQYQKTYGSLKGAEYQIEEFVRQWVLKRLIGVYRYPSHWIGTQIDIEESVFIGARQCRVDIALKNRFDYPFIYIETKSYKASDIGVRIQGQLMSYLSSMHTANIGCATNGMDTMFLKKEPDSFVFISDIPTAEEAIEQGLITAEDIQPSVEENDTPTKGTTTLRELPPIPTVQEYSQALFAIERSISDKQRAILKAHYHAPDRMMTMTEIAQAVGYTNFRAANLQYGRLGNLLCDALGWRYGVHINVIVSFIPPQNSPNRQWLLIMRPEIADALKLLGWV